VSVGVQVLITRDDFTPALKAQLEALQPRAIAKEVGEALVTTTQKHLRANGTNKRGWRTTNFWSRAARSTSWTATDEGTVISINQIGVRQRFFGGRIAPVNAKALTIPISASAYGKTSKDFPDAFLIRTPKGAYIVRYGGSFTATGKFSQRKRTITNYGKKQDKAKATLEFLFKLVGSVTQKEDRTVLPHFMTYRQVVFQQLERIVARGGKAGAN
jgi:hypothetical protein